MTVTWVAPTELKRSAMIGYRWVAPSGASSTDPYSDRRAIIGSTFVARRAGR
jgi:hypothetical protein